MLKPKPTTPLRRTADNSNPPTLGENEFSLPRPPFVRRHSSTPSGESLGKKIQRHLDAGNPLYIGFDPADPPRDSTLVAGPAGGGDTGGCTGEEKRTTAGRGKGWGRKVVKVLCCGIPLDVCARTTLTIGMMAALLSLLYSVNRLIRMLSPRDLNCSILPRILILKISELKAITDPDSLTFTSCLIVYQCCWGVFFGATCFFGFILMWGKWRRSPTAALFFTVTWILVTTLQLVTSILWFYFYFFFRRKYFTKCHEKTTSAGPEFGRDAPVRQATQDQIDFCMMIAQKEGGGVLFWGVVYIIMLYFGIIIAVWGRDYRRRLLEIRECEKLTKGPGAEGEKVGLLLGTAPLGRLAHSRRMTIGPTKSELEGSRAEEEPRPKDTIVRFSGTVRVGKAVPTSSSSSSSSREQHRGRKGSNSSTESLGLGISVEGQSFVGGSPQARSVAY